MTLWRTGSQEQSRSFLHSTSRHMLHLTPSVCPSRIANFLSLCIEQSLDLLSLWPTVSPDRSLERRMVSACVFPSVAFLSGNIAWDWLCPLPKGQSFSWDSQLGTLSLSGLKVRLLSTSYSFLILGPHICKLFILIFPQIILIVTLPPATTQPDTYPSSIALPPALLLPPSPVRLLH